MNFFRYVLLKLYTVFSANRISIGITKSVLGWPRIRAKGNSSITIGRHSRLSKCRLTAVSKGRIKIDEYTSIGYNDIIVSHGEITIGERCSFGPNVCVYDHDHCFGPHGKEKGFKIGSVRIGNNVWLGAGVIVLRNSNIGDNCVVGAGTVVYGNIPDNSLVTGTRELIVKPLGKRPPNKGET